MVGLNPTDHQIQALINEKEFDGKRSTAEMNVSFFFLQLTVPMQYAVCAVDENRE